MQKNKIPKDIFNEGDIIVREYKNGKTAIGIFTMKVLNDGQILYLDKSFTENGGLVEFDKYGLGGYWDELVGYRHANEKELYKIANKLKNDIYNNHMYNGYYDIDGYLNLVKKNISKLRKEKINKINKIKD